MDFYLKKAVQNQYKQHDSLNLLIRKFKLFINM